MGGIARRILFAWYFNDVNLLLSSYITGDPISSAPHAVGRFLYGYVNPRLTKDLGRAILAPSLLVAPGMRLRACS